MIAGKDPTDKMVKYDSSIGEASPETMSKEEPETPRPGELSSISEIQCYLRKYSTTSSVFAEQSISNPDYQKTLYCISCILQAELFDDLSKAARYPPSLNPELNITTSLPPHLGGLQPRIPEDVLARETADDLELREQLERGTVPTVDTILRFISWLHQSAKYSAQCNIIAFIYIKRMMDSKCVLTMHNWRGMWLGCIILAQKVWDDASLRTSSFASILPGVTKSNLKALELKIFMLLNYATSVKPSIYARFYFELREIFKTITGELVQNSNPDNRSGKPGRRRPLTVKNANLLKCSSEDPRITPQSSKQTSPRSGRTNGHSNYTSYGNSAFTTNTQSRASTATAPATQTQSAWLPATSPKGRAAQGLDGPASYGEHSTSSAASGVSGVSGASTGTGYTTLSASTLSAQPTRCMDDGAGSSALRAGALPGAAPNGTLNGTVNGTLPAAGENAANRYMTAASTPSNNRNKRAQAARPNRPLSITYEDFTYTKSTIFVIS